MRHAAVLAVVLLAPALGHAAGPTHAAGPPPSIYGADSFSVKNALPTGPQAALLRAQADRARVFVRGTALTRPSRAQLRLLAQHERSPGIWASSDLMEREIEETEPMALHAVTAGISVVTLREPDVEDSGPRHYGNGNYRQVRLGGYAGGAVELDVAIPVSGHFGTNDYRHYARTNTYGVKLTDPDGSVETFARVPSGALGLERPLVRGDYVTVMRLRLADLARGETKLEIWPEATSVRGYLNGRTLGVFH